MSLVNLQILQDSATDPNSIFKQQLFAILKLPSKGVSVAFAVEEVNRSLAYNASLKENIGVEHRPQ